MTHAAQAAIVAAGTARIAQLRESIARRALDTIGTPANARIFSVVRTGTVLTVATEQPGQYYPYAVDSFRFPTPDLDDPHYIDEADAPLRWTLLEQIGGCGQDEVDQMIADAITYARSIA